MKIELKNVRVNEKLSDDSTAFSADIYIEGVKAGYATNDGNGGETNWNSYKGKDDLISKAEKFCDAQPPDKFEHNGKMLEIRYDLPYHIDRLLDDYLTEKEQARFNRAMAKDMLRSVVWGKPNGKDYKVIRWKTVTIAELLTTDIGRLAISKAVKDARSSCEAGEEILNTNIPKYILEHREPTTEEKMEMTAILSADLNNKFNRFKERMSA